MLLAEMTTQGHWLCTRLDLQVGFHGALNLKCVGDTLHWFWDRAIHVAVGIISIRLMQMKLLVTARILSMTGSYVFCLFTLGGKTPFPPHSTSTDPMSWSRWGTTPSQVRMGPPARSGWGTPWPGQDGVLPVPRDSVCLDRLCRWRYASCGFPQEDCLVVTKFLNDAKRLAHRCNQLLYAWEVGRLAFTMCSVDKFLKVLKRPEDGIYVLVITDVVTEIFHRGLEHWSQPECIDS